MKRGFQIIILVSLGLLVNSCKTSGGVASMLFPIDKDIALGQRLKEEIASNPAEYPVLDSAAYPEAYGHILRIRDNILNAGGVQYKDEFTWEVKIIHDDNVLNAFAAPGGFIYVYTGLIKYLESEDQLAGVLGHEIAHADKRHSVNQMVKNYGVQILFDVILGENQGTLTQMAQGLTNLSFSRSDESQADEYSVIYLCPTEYNASGAAGFFEKIEASGGSSTPEFLSTHPDPENRVNKINDFKILHGCSGTKTTGDYQSLLNSLP